MRVSGGMLYKRISSSLASAQRKIAEVSEPLISGHRVNRPSEDPVRAERLAKAARETRRSDQFREAGGRNMIYHQMAETTVQGVVDVLGELSTLAIGMANDTLSAADRKAGATSASQLLQTLKSYGNAKFNGRHIFAGRRQDQAAYDAAGVFQGDSIGRMIEVSAGMRVPGDVTGPMVFGTAGSTAFEAAQALSDALNNDDTKAIQEALGKVNSAHSVAVESLSHIGFNMLDMSRADGYEDERQFVLELRRGRLDEVDVAEAASQLAFAEATYNTAIQVASRINRLLDSITRL